jgi:lysophospholipase L1-like esterase
LHVTYASADQSQMDYALDFLAAADDETKPQLVTLTLGANDLLVLQGQCAASQNGVPAAIANCILTQLNATLGQAAANLQAIIATLRGAGYSKKIIVNNYYYPTKYGVTGDLNFLGIAYLNQTIGDVVAGFKAAGDNQIALADQFNAFRVAAAGNPCTAGLIAIDPQTRQCEIHPTDAGDRLLADTVEATLETF